VGIKPLYYFDDGTNIIVGTHLKNFYKVKGFTPQINTGVLGEYLQFGFILQPHTIFHNTYKVCAGEYHCFNLNSQEHSKNLYWKLESCYEGEKYCKNENKVLEDVDKLLNSLITKEFDNKSFGLSLSGGYDSSTLAAITQSQHNQKVDTFTIGFHDKNINEAHHAKEIANFLGTNHHEHYFSGDDAINVIPKICEVFDEPFADYAAAPTIITSELLKQHGIQKLIAGDGGDEVFATAENVNQFRRLQKLPKQLRSIMAKSINSIKLEHLPYLRDYKNLPIKQNKLQQLLLADTIPKMIYSRNTLFLDNELKHLVKNYHELAQTSFDMINFFGSAETVDEVIGSYFKTTMVDGELVKSYSTTNFNDISLSTPYLQEELISYMAKVPSALKIKNGIKKYLLKEIAHQYIPKSLIERPKSGFAIPFGSWMKNELKDILFSQINKKRLDKDNIFYTTSILRIRDNFYAGNDAYKYKLWRIFIFQLWYENFQNSLQSTKD
jgi:asparagine synthase (glutamine-hydrolysing)